MNFGHYKEMTNTAARNAFTSGTTKFRKPSVRSLYDYQETLIVPKSCRSAKEAFIGYSDVSVGRALRSPFLFFSNINAWRMKENFLIRSLHHYGMDWESPFTNHVYETEVTSVRLNMVYLHMWLLKFHLGQPLKNKNFV